MILKNHPFEVLFLNMQHFYYNDHIVTAAEAAMFYSVVKDTRIIPNRQQKYLAVYCRHYEQVDFRFASGHHLYIQH